MNRKASTFIRLGLTVALIAVTIWFFYIHYLDLWIGSGSWSIGHNYMHGYGMSIIMLIIWIVLIGALLILISGLINERRFSKKSCGYASTFENSDPVLCSKLNQQG